MKKNVKRFVSMTMAMLVAAGSLAGCGGGGSESPQRQRLIQAVHPVVR